MQLDHRIDAGPQVQPSRAGRGVLRWHVPEARINQFDVDTVHERYSSRLAMWATIRRAISSFSPAGSGWHPILSNSVTALVSRPSPSCTRLPTISGTFLALRLPSAYSARSRLSA